MEHQRANAEAAPAMQLQDSPPLCASCTTMDPVHIVETGKLPARQSFTISYTNNCHFCQFCIQALAPKTASVDNFSVEIDAECRYQYHTKTTFRQIWWLEISVVGLLSSKTPPSIKIHQLREPHPDLDELSDKDCYRLGRRVRNDIDPRLFDLWISSCDAIHKTCRSP